MDATEVFAEEKLGNKINELTTAGIEVQIEQLDSRPHFQFLYNNNFVKNIKLVNRFASKFDIELPGNAGERLRQAYLNDRKLLTWWRKLICVFYEVKELFNV